MPMWEAVCGSCGAKQEPLVGRYTEEMSSQKVLLIGEIIIDQYVFCNAIGKSGKEPVMVVKRLDSEIYR